MADTLRLHEVSRDAFTLLRAEPLLFLPRIITTFIWSFFWLYAAKIVMGDVVPTLFDLGGILLFAAIMAPAQVWVYTMYFFVVQQQSVHDYDLRAAAWNGIRRLPRAIGAFTLIGIVTSLASLPGIFLASLGLVSGQDIVFGLGVVMAVVTFLGVAALFYFTPVAVVLGSNGFWTNVRQSIGLSQTSRRDVTVLVLLSFGMLGVTLFVQGVFETLGLIGFILGRTVSAVIGVYVLVMNPELFIDVTEER